MKDIIDVALVGACGRMGVEIARLIESDPNMHLTAALESVNHLAVGKDYGATVGLPFSGVTILPVSEDSLKDASVVIDFTSPDSLERLIAICDELRKPLVSGTTGVDDRICDKLKEASERIPILFSPNMSKGVNLLFRLMEILGPMTKDFDTEIVETHHNRKKDAPSGTALRLGEIIASSRNQVLSEVSDMGRSGIAPREEGTIGFHAVRCGDVAGEHTVIFGTDGERIEITHKAHSRLCLASGAVEAAKWLSSRNRPGLYDMSDVIQS